MRALRRCRVRRSTRRREATGCCDSVSRKTSTRSKKPAAGSENLLLLRSSLLRRSLFRSLLLSARFLFRGRDAFRQLRAAGLAIPLFELLGRDLSLDEQLREFATLCLTLERHGYF